MRASALLPLATLLFLVTTAAEAAPKEGPPKEGAPNRQACVTAYEDTQISMRRSRLLHAREALQTCLNGACPAVLRSDCAGWLKEVEARTPSVVVELSGGTSPQDARLFVDGELHTSGIDGKAMELDPGSHTFRVETPGSAPVTVDTLIREGEKLKVVKVTLPNRSATKTSPDVQVEPPSNASSPPPGPQTTGHRPVPWTVFAAAGIGIAAGAGFGWFAASGSSKKGDLEPCKPDCSADRISDVRTQFIVADVLLGVTALAIGTAAYLFVTRPAVVNSSARSVPTPAPSGLAFSVDAGGGRFTF
jgi:hypothetical protein